MNKKPVFLDSDSSVFEENLRFVKNDFDEEMKSLFGSGSGDHETPLSNKKFKIIKPNPGLCIKAFRLGGGGKVFVNICQTDDILAPKDLNEDELMEILNSDEPNAFKIPMSISEPYSTKDKSGQEATSCDIAINTQFFSKIRDSTLFSNFLTALVFEAIDNKYQVKCEEDNWTILKNLKCMSNGKSLKSHRIEDRDNEQVKQYYNIPSEKSGKRLVQVIDESDAEKLKGQANSNKHCTPKPVKLGPAKGSSKKPEYRLIKKLREDKTVEKIIGEFHLPDVIAASEITVDVGEDKILIESKKRNYFLEGFIADFVIKADQAQSDFDTGRSVLTVHMPVTCN